MKESNTNNNNYENTNILDQQIKLLHDMENDTTEQGIPKAKIVWYVKPSSTTNSTAVTLSLEKTQNKKLSGVPLLITNISEQKTTLSDKEKINLLLCKENMCAITCRIDNIRKTSSTIINTLQLEQLQDTMHQLFVTKKSISSEQKKQSISSRPPSIDLNVSRQNNSSYCPCNCCW